MSEQKYLTLESFDAYNVSLELANYIWDLVVVWEWFAKKTVGAQIVTSGDSISANIAEGFGRYHKKDKIKFYRYSQGSLKEVKDWVNKIEHRKLAKPEEIEWIKKETRISRAGN